ncbi:MAG: DEAD/DEAH box helicase [Pseudomonadota bacterium]
MAQLIPNLSTCLSRMTSGEKRLARRLEAFLEDDYLCWYDILVGRRGRYPDFIVLHPSRGLLFLEVKDWKLDTIRKISKSHVELLTDNGRTTVSNPIEQVRQCAYQVINQLERDDQLVNHSGDHAGKLKFPYGYGVVFTNIAREPLRKALTPEGEQLLPDHMLLCKDEMTENEDPEAFQQILWGMFNYDFGNKLSMPEIERIRWHLFPELRIEGEQLEIEISEEQGDQTGTEPYSIPEIIRVMDLQQEQLARNLGTGHRVIHGVAGSGKTMILGFRAAQLAEVLSKPILVLCFNITLAARLRHFAAEKRITGSVQVYHFHDWCGQQLKAYHCNPAEGDAPFWERQVAGVIAGVEKSRIPRAQYGAVLIDEGHDFEPEWLQLVTQMVDPETDALLLLYDDAQAIYRKKAALNFSLSSVGIKARGRTTILKLNYRNTREILKFAYRFAEEFIAVDECSDDDIPVIEPESAGAVGPQPVFRQFERGDDEYRFIVQCVSKWLSDGNHANEIAIIVPGRPFARSIAERLSAAGIDNSCLVDKQTKAGYSPGNDQVTILTIHSSKGLEFDRVILAGVHGISHVADDMPEQVRLMYVGMTRAKSRLLVTSSDSTVFTERLVDLVAP